MCPQLPRHRRGAALHARPRAPAVGDAGRRAARRRLPEPSRPRGARPLPQLQGLQIRVPGAGGHGRIKSEFLAQRYKGRLHPAASLHLRLCRQAGALGFAHAGADQRAAHRPAHQPAHQAHRGRSARAPASAPGCASYQKSIKREESQRREPPPGRLAAPQVLWSGPIPGTTTTTRKRSPPPNLSSPGRLPGETPQGHICCGRPLYDFGLLGAPALSGQSPRPHGSADRRRAALHLSGAKLRQRLQGRVAGALSQRPRAQRLSGRSGCWPTGSPPKLPEWATGTAPGRAHLLHGHCHHKAVFGGPASEIALLRAGRRHGRAHPGRLLRHGRALRL
jgi:hypothetical protein